MITGIPDLYVVINGFIPVLLEAKWLGEVNVNFKRKVNYSPMQIKWITDCNQVQPFTALGIIGVKYDKYSYECFIQEVHKGDNYLSSQAKERIYYEEGKFNVIKLFEKIGIPKVNKEVVHMEHSDIATTLHRGPINQESLESEFELADRTQKPI